MPNREKVIRAVDSCFNYWLEQHSCLHPAELEKVWKFKADALVILKEQETVVCCKDCIYADDFDCPAPLPTGYLCQKGHGSHLGHWFCADGERR